MANKYGMDNKVPVVPPLSSVRIEVRSHNILNDLQPEALFGENPVDIERIFEIDLPRMFPGLKTAYIDLSIKGHGVLGYTSAAEKVCLVDKTLYDKACAEFPCEVDVRRFRATVGHEVSHCICHYPILDYFESFNSDIRGSLMRVEKRKDIRAFEDPEWQAWQMAGAILMPLQRIRADLKNGMGSYEIAEKYDVNPAFAEARIRRIMKLNEKGCQI